MGKKEKKSKTTEQKARVAARQSKRAAQKDKKVKSKGVDDSDGEDVDLETVLEDYAKKVCLLDYSQLRGFFDGWKNSWPYIYVYAKLINIAVVEGVKSLSKIDDLKGQAQFVKVTEVSCDPPSPRSSATLIASPANTKELFLFGGEYYNGGIATFFNDLFVYHIEKDEWRRVTSPNSPLPRSGHAWCRGGNSGGIYLFGGEFSSPKQGTFYHYNDFWRLDPSNGEWTRIETRGKGPPARSGHRMTYHKNYILLFGGFQDASSSTKYLQDLWIYDCQNFTWHNSSLPPATQKPDARSSFSFLPHEAGAVIYGGYSRVKSTALVGKQSKGGNQGVRAILKPTIHQDTWFLRISQPASEASGSVPPAVRWERRKKPANPPNPPRAGATMTYHKGRGILFGGVHDVEENEEGIESEFFDTLFAWNIERNRYFQLSLRRARATPKRQADDRGNAKRSRGKADEAELLRNLAALESQGSIAGADEMKTESAVTLDGPLVKPAKPILVTLPHARFNAQLTVQDDVLYIFGGTYENGDREYTFDEMWAIDLGKLDGVEEIYRRELENWLGSDDEESISDSNSEDESEDEELERNTPMGVLLPPVEPGATSKAEPPSVMEQASEPETDDHETKVADDRPHPRPFESLREFFARTSNLWQDIVLEVLRHKDTSVDRSIKELRKLAFETAEIKWWDCREEITALEDEQEAAGIGEVFSIADRTVEAGGIGRRR